MANTVQDALCPFRGPRIQPSYRASRIPPSRWTDHREIIEDLYINQEKTLEKVIETMKRDHNFHATPRQYTLKFKSWHLQKNIRHTEKRKPRHTISVCGVATGARGHAQRPASFGLIPNGELDSLFDNARTNDYRTKPATPPLQGMLEDSFDSIPFSGTDGHERNATILDELGEAVQAAGPTALSQVGSDGDHEIPKDMGSLRVSKRGPPRPAGNLPEPFDMLNSDRIALGALRGVGIPVSELNKQVFEKGSGVILAIWGAWLSGQPFQFDSVSSDVEHYFRLRHDAYPITGELHEWTALYPRHSDPVPLPASRPPMPSHGTDCLLSRMFAERGCMIALKKRRASARREAYVSQSTGKLVAAMLLDRDKTTRLRHCFSLVLTQLEPVLEDCFKDLEAPCRGLIKLFPLRISRLEDPRKAGYSQRKHEAAMLAMVCDQEFKARGIYESMAFSAITAMIHKKCVLIWAARLVLYYAAPTLAVSPLPPNLCLRALDGCKQILNRIHHHPRQSRTDWGRKHSQSPVSDEWQDARFASIWAEWICCDSDFFLYHQLKKCERGDQCPGRPLRAWSSVSLDL